MTRCTTRRAGAAARDERGITTAEYAVGTAAGAGLAGPALQAADRRVRRPDAAVAVRPRPGAAGDRMSASRRGERGAVTAELAMALPLLVAVTVGLVWLLAIGAAQLRVVDAARETARAVARGDAEAAAVALGRAGRARGRGVHRAARPAARCTSSVVGPGRRARAGSSTSCRRSSSQAEAVAAAEEPAVSGRGETRRGQPVRGGLPLGPAPAVGAALGVVAAMVTAHRSAQSAADLAALGGRAAVAEGGDACAAPRRIAAANGAALDSCAVVGPRRRGDASRSPARAGWASPATCRPRPGPGPVSRVVRARGCRRRSVSSDSSRRSASTRSSFSESSLELLALAAALEPALGAELGDGEAPQDRDAGADPDQEDRGARGGRCRAARRCRRWRRARRGSRSRRRG